MATLRAAVNSVPTNLVGMALMIVAAGLATAMHASVRILSADLHPLEIVFLRQVAVGVILLPWLLRFGIGVMKTNRFTFHLGRGLCQSVSNSLWFWALSLVPLAKVSALSFSQVLFAVVGAIVFLGEKPRMARWIALAVGFVGILVIVQPGAETIGLGIVLVLVSRIFVAANKVISKSLTGTESSATILAYSAVIISTATLVPTIFVWQMPAAQDWIWIAAIGAFGFAGQFCMLQAYKLADLGAVEPLGFSRVLWAALFGYILFAEIPSAGTWIGGALVVLAVSYLARSESKAERKADAGATAPVLE
jgi:drug/metabolite transporter (DMT)-like permease